MDAYFVFPRVNGTFNKAELCALSPPFFNVCPHKVKVVRKLIWNLKRHMICKPVKTNLFVFFGTMAMK